MRVIYSPDAPIEIQFTCEPPTAARKSALDAIRMWSDPAGLVSLAIARHGYHNTNCGFGITYPEDLDEHDLTQQPAIPPDHVEVSAWYGESNGPIHLLLESEYLELLRQYLQLIGRSDAADQIGGFIATFARRDPVKC